MLISSTSSGLSWADLYTWLFGYVSMVQPFIIFLSLVNLNGAGFVPFGPFSPHSHSYVLLPSPRF